MAASMSVSVLCPNGRKQVVKVTLNTSILYVLEEACKKQHLNAEEYDVKHCNKVLDLSLSIRFANIPNNGVLEMCPSVKGIRSTSQVTVGLHLEDSRRLFHEFDCVTTLGEIISYWKEKCGEEDLRGGLTGEPVCIYMRKEVIGEKALLETSLKSLGLTGGKVIVRLIYRPSEVMGRQAYVEALEPVKKDPPVDWGTFSSTSRNTADDDWGKTEVTWDTPTNSSRIDDAKWPCSENKPPGENGNTSSPEFWDSTDNTGTLKEQSQSERGMSFENGTLDPVSDDNVKSEIEDVEMAEVDEDEKKDDEVEEEKIVYLGERDAVLFNMNSVPKLTHEDLPDEFYDLTINDAKYLLSDLQRKRVELENQPLELSSQRESKKQELVQKYKQTVLRIHFPDRLVLQAKFTPLETVSAVMNFIRKFVTDPSENFYLYTTPPQLILDSESTLLNADLVPAANVHFGSQVIRNTYLKPDILQQVSTLGAASQAAAKLRNVDKISSRPTKRGSDVDVTLPSEVKVHTSESSCEMPAAKKEAKTDVPKWFKLSKEW